MALILAHSEQVNLLGRDLLDPQSMQRPCCLRQ
jgi:hypothetical protein